MNLPACLIVILATATAQPASSGPGAADDEYLALHRAFVVLYESLRAGGGVGSGDDAVIRVFRQRAATFAAGHPDFPQALAMQLQVSLWLGDEDRVSELYAQLTTVTDDLDIGLAWATHAQGLDDPRRVGEVFTKLAGIFPGEKRILIDWAGFYALANLYPRALEILESADLDPATEPRGVIALSDYLFAEHRFPEAVAALESIPADLLQDDASLVGQVESLLDARREYPELWSREQQVRVAEASADDLPRVELVTARGRIVMELFENEAPNTVANFIVLAESGYYEGIKFHRVLPNFMAQAGDRNTRDGGAGAAGSGGPGYRIPDEFARDGARQHFTGTLSMAKTPGPDTGGSQFFITHTPTVHLNGKHTVFGRVLSGLDVARSIEPNEVIVSLGVLRKRDHEYEPQKLPEAVAPITPPISPTFSPTFSPPNLTPSLRATPEPPPTEPAEDESDDQ